MNHLNLKLMAIPLFVGLTMLTACGKGTALDTKDTTMDSAQTFTLTKISQRTQRFDCNDNLQSDQVETVQMPVQEVSISPSTPGTVYSFNVTDLTNGHIAQMTANNTSLYIDCGDGALSLWVNQGINQLNYQFTTCDKFTTDPTTGQSTSVCADTPTTLDSGSFYINVSCVEQTLSGIRSIHPTADQCPSSAK